MPNATINCYPDSSQLFEAAARTVAAELRQAISERGHAWLALAGGSTPKGLFRAMVSLPPEQQPDWEQVDYFFGDERDVPSDHPDANFRMACENLLQPLGISPARIQRVKTELPPDEAVADYQARLRALPQVQGWPCFDLILLGMGEDGHTASLFPHSSLLNEHQAPFCHGEVSSKGARYSLTLPVLREARQLMLLVSGSGKANTLRSVFHEPGAGLPVQQLATARLSWFVDADAASKLSQDCQHG